MKRNPLHGIRVLELGQFIAGPYAGLQLADLGADVIKVERPGSGDPFRQFGIASRHAGYSHNFCAFNRNKRSLALDVNSEAGQAAFLRAVERADVLVENFRAGVMGRLGLGYDRLAARNPGLVYCSISGFAEDGPNPDRPAYDAVGQAVSGLLSLTVDPEDPRILGPTISDQVTGLQACMGILAALHERSRGGRGARIEISMVEATMALMPDSFTAYTQGGVVVGPESRSAASMSFAFRCSDGRLIAIHVSSTEKFWRGLLAAIERADLGENPLFLDRPRRVRNYHALVDVLRPVFATRSREEWMERLAARDVPAAPVHSVPEAMSDGEVRHLGLFHQLEHPRYGATTAMHRALRIDRQREADPLPPPALGEHTEAVLRELGFAAAEIDLLLREGVAAADLPGPSTHP